MTFVTDVARLCLRLCILLALILGITFWTGHGQRDVPIHMAIGLIFVISLWTLGVVGLMSKASLPLSLLALAWGFLVIWLGLAQVRLMMTNHLHWMLQVLHLLVGLAAIGIGEVLGKRVLATRDRLPSAT
jgi:hypothetical protein